MPSPRGIQTIMMAYSVTCSCLNMNFDPLSKNGGEQLRKSQQCPLASTYTYKHVSVSIWETETHNAHG